MSVNPNQRFTRAYPCPVCSGHDGAPRGVGTRCHGFLSDDGRFAHCTREEFASGLQLNPESGTFAHLLDGACACGRSHRESVPRLTDHDTTARLVDADSFNGCPHPYPCDYTDDDGNVLFRVARWRKENGEKSYAYYRPLRGGWVAGLNGMKTVLYRLPAIVAAVQQGVTIHVVEGEKKVHLLDRVGITSTCNSGGAKKFTIAHAQALREAKRVVVWADNDKPGGEHAEQTARLLHEAGVRDIRLPVLPGLQNGKGIDDWLVARGDAGSKTVGDELHALANAAPRWMPASGASETTKEDDVVITLLSDVQAVPVEWLWQARIPLGMLTILDGDPGLGKSSIALDIAARLTRGRTMPDGTPGPNASGVVILSAEDDTARVIRPRLDAAGAAVERVAVVGIKDENGLERSPVITPADLRAVEKAIRSVNAKLVIVDPLMAYLPGSVNANRDHDVRLALVALSKMAERTGAAVLIIRHLNKNVGGSAIYRGGGSIGIIAAARSGMLLGRDPDDSTGASRVLVMVKSNLAATAPGLLLRLVDGPSGEAQRVSWEGTAQHTAESLLAVATNVEDRSALDEAEEFLNCLLSDGPVPATEVKRKGTANGISYMSLRRAADRMNVKRTHVGQPGGRGQHWVWQLARPVTSVPEMITASDNPNDEHLRESNDDKFVCRDEEAEGVPADGEEHLRETEHPQHAEDHTSSECETDAAEKTCACGGRVLPWESGPICTVCHTRYVADADGIGGGAYA